MKAKKAFTLSDMALAKLVRLQSIYNYPNASQTIEACVVRMQEPRELQEFNAFVEHTFAMFAKVRAMNVRRLSVMTKMAEGIGTLGLSKEQVTPLFKLFGEFGTEDDIPLDVFLEKGAADYAKLTKMMDGEVPEIDNNAKAEVLGAEILSAVEGEESDFFQLAEQIRVAYNFDTIGQAIEKAIFEYGSMQEFMQREQTKLTEILANKERVWSLVAGLLAQRKDPEAEEKTSELGDEMGIEELEKLAAEAGLVVSRTAMN
jgi:hypothetical protein